MDLVAPGDAPHLPEMKNVEQWIMGGILMKPAAGDLVIVTFRDEKKTRPIVVGMKLGAGPFPALARVGDSVSVFFPATMPVTGVLTPPGSSFVGTLTVPSPGLGMITIGSTKLGGES